MWANCAPPTHKPPPPPCRSAREEVEKRAQIQKKIAAREKESKEDELRALAQRAREERGATAAAITGEAAAPLPPPPAADGGSDGGGGGSDDDDGADGGDVAERDELRRERKRERERERRLENRDGKRSKMTRDAGDGRCRCVPLYHLHLLHHLLLHRNLHFHLTSSTTPSAERDVSERIALGQAVPNSTETLYDQRLFNQSAGIGSGFTAQDDAYNIYDKALFRGGAAAESLYRPTRGAQEDEWADEEKAAENVLKAARFKAGDRGFEGSREQGENQRAQGAPVEFEADADEADPFGLDQFLSEAKRGKALDKIGEGSGMAAAAGGASGTGDSSRSIGFARGKP